jgi:ribosomal protein S13
LSLFALRSELTLADQELAEDHLVQDLQKQIEELRQRLADSEEANMRIEMEVREEVTADMQDKYTRCYRCASHF